MRQQDKQNGKWRSYRGYRNAAWLSGVLRMGNTPGMFYLMQTNNEGHMLPIHLKKDLILPGNYREGSALKVYARLMGVYNDDHHRIDTRIFALDFDTPGISEMPLVGDWQKKLPAGVQDTQVFPSFFGQESKGNVVTKDRGNVVEVAGHVSGLSMERERIVGDRTLPRRLYVYLQQSEDPLTSIVVRFKGRNVASLKDKLVYGAPVVVKGCIRVKHIPIPGAVGDGDGVIPTFQIMFIDGNVGGKIEPGICTAGETIPVNADIPQWAKDLYYGGKDAVREALKKLIEAKQGGAQSLSKAERVGSAIDAVENDLVAHLDQIDA